MPDVIIPLPSRSHAITTRGNVQPATLTVLTGDFSMLGPGPRPHLANVSPTAAKQQASKAPASFANFSGDLSISGNATFGQGLSVSLSALQIDGIHGYQNHHHRDDDDDDLVIQTMPIKRRSSLADDLERIARITGEKKHPKSDLQYGKFSFDKHYKPELPVRPHDPSPIASDPVPEVEEEEEVVVEEEAEEEIEVISAPVRVVEEVVVDEPPAIAETSSPVPDVEPPKTATMKARSLLRKKKAEEEDVPTPLLTHHNLPEFYNIVTPKQRSDLEVKYEVCMPMPCVPGIAYSCRRSIEARPACTWMTSSQASTATRPPTTTGTSYSMFAS